MGRKHHNKFKKPIGLDQFPDEQILVEAAIRRGQSVSELIKPTSPSPGRVSLQEWKFADLALQNIETPNWNPMLRIYDNIDIDLDLTSVTETRSLKVQQAKYNLVDANSKPNEEAKKLLDKTWFRDFIKIAMRRVTRGYQLAEIFDFDDKGELLKCDFVNPFHVKPTKGIVTIQESDEIGTSYLEGNQQLYYIPIGKKNDFGLYRKIAPIILAKKYAIGHWSSFNEKMGIPFRTVESKSTDKLRQQQLGVILDQMGSAGWAVLNEGEKVTLLEISGTNPTQCFETFINMLNAQIAMVMNGQSSTADSSKQKGTYGSLKILNEISKDRHESDLTDIKDLVNNVLIPRLILISPFYAPLKELTLEWDYSEQLSVTEVTDVIVSLTGAGYKISAEEVSKKTGLKVEEGPGPGVKNRISVPDPAKVQAKKKSLNARLNDFYESCCNKHGLEATAKAIPSFKDDVLRIARQLFDNKHSGIVDIPLMKKTATYIREAITSGYIAIGDPIDTQMLATLERNVFVFSGFKTYQQLQSMSGMLKGNDGTLRSWPDFKTEVLKVDQKYNVNYLKAEYDHAVVCAQMASQWQDIQRNKDVLPFLQFDATNDNRTTPICSSLDGTTLPVDDSFWNTYYLPLHWGERSVIRQVSRGTATDKTKLALPDLQPMFEGNVGKTGIAFPKSHPYYEESVKTASQINDAAFIAQIQATREDVRNWSKKNISDFGNKYQIKNDQFDTLTLRKGDVKTVTGKSHAQAPEAYNSLMNIENLFKNAKYIGSSPEVKNHLSVVDWLYYQVEIANEISYLNVMVTTAGEFRLHSISDKIGFNKKKIVNKAKK